MGRPKAWLPIGPERLLQRVVRLVGEVAGPIVVVAAPGQDLPALPAEVRIARDEVEGLGPLQGLAIGLEALGGGVTFAYATATDVPFLVPAWIARLAALIEDDDLAIPEAGGFLQPLAALYRVSAVLPAIRGLLAEGRRRPTDLAGLVRARRIGADVMRVVDPDLMTLENLNTPEDYRVALGRAGFPADASAR